MKRIKLLCLFLCFCSIPLSAQKSEKGESNAVEPSTISLAKLVQQKSADYVITAEHVSRTSGIRHVYLRQAINGLEVYGTESSVHFDHSGKAIVTHNKFLNNVSATVKSASASLTAEQAIRSVASQMGYKLSSLQQLKDEGGLNKKALFNKAGISLSEIPAKLMYYYKEGQGTRMIWELSVQETGASNDWWNFRVDAASGKIIDKDNWTLSCNILEDHNKHFHSPSGTDNLTFVGPLDNPTKTKVTSSKVYEENSALVGSYNVYAIPTESPNHGGRTLVANPDDPTASPFGWHDTNGVAGAESTLTTGNNVDAHKVADRPDGTAALNFNFTINLAQDPTLNTPPYITNLFYWNNITHDILYLYGFDEASGNFQENNYGNGGVGSDGVNANAQAVGNCNANFGTPADGSNPTMNMFLCNLSTPSHDGDLDNGVIVHEYGHGVSNRLTGGGANVSCLNNQEQMGEGWSDIYGIIFTIEPGDTGTDARGVGTYLLGEPITGPGVRTQRYSTDFGVNNHTYDDIIGAVAPHGVGEIWATMLWEMTWEIMAVAPFDADVYNGTGGNNIALALITEGLKLQPCSPGFVDGRDAILAADQALYGGAYQCEIWAAFARRGLGYSANQGSSGSKTDGTEAFDLPPTFSSLNAIDEVCLADGVQTGLSGGNPAGGVYSGAGVTDNGDGLTFDFDPAVGGPGLVTVSYLVNDFCTGLPTSIDDDIDVTDDPPVIVCRGSGTIPMNGSASASPGTPIPSNTTVTSTINVAQSVSITDLNVDLNIPHTWISDLTMTLQSPAGTIITIFDPPGSCDANDVITLLDDEAPTTSSACYGTGTNTPAYPDPSYQPFSPLSAFDGENTAGIWTLSVTDGVGGDTGTLTSWALNYTYDVVSTPLDVFLDGTGNATINASDLLYSSSVACGGMLIEGGTPFATTVSFTTADIGLTNVDMRVTSDTGQISICTAVANVIASACDLAITNATATAETAPGANDGTITVTATCTTCAGISYSVTPTAPPGPAITQVGNGSFTGLPPNSYDVTTEDTGDPTCTASWASNPVVVAAAGGDTTPPVITCPANTTVECGGDTSPTGTGTATATDDTDPNPVISFVDSSVPGCGNTETITRVWTATDAAGNASSCTQTITVVDTTPPVVTCPANTTVECGGDTSPAGTGTATATDGCGTVAVTFADTSAPGCGNTEVITRVWTATDECGNTSTCTQTITVVDTTPPVVTCPANATVECGGDTSPAGTGTATATDGCGTTAITFADSSVPGCGNTEVITRVWTATDACGNTSTCTQTITVVDTTPPVITCPADATVECGTGGGTTSGTATASYTGACQSWPDTGGGSTGLVATLTADITGIPAGATIDDVDISFDIDHSWVGDLNISLQSPDGTTVLVIDNVTCGGSGNSDNVTATFDDSAAGTASASCIASVSTAGPHETCPTEQYAINAALNGSYQPNAAFSVFNGENAAGTWTLLVSDDVGGDGGAIANFSVDIDWSATVVATDPSITGMATAVDGCGTTNVTYADTAVPGCGNTEVITRVWTATDECGNTSSCTQTITVVDTTPPVANCPADISVNNDPGVCGAVVTYVVDGTDTCGSVTVNQTGGLASGDTFPVGVTTNTFDIVDDCGNTSSCSFTVTVTDNENPVIACPADISVSTTPGDCFSVVTFPDAIALDNCGVASVVQTAGLPSGSQFPVGVSTIEYTATDIHGNTAVCSFTITVTDNEPAMAVCMDITIQLDANGDASIVAADVDGGSTDNCGIASMSIDVDTFDCSDVGDNPVVLTVTDVHGNVSSCTAIVTVEDVTPPVAVCMDITVQLDPTGTITILGSDVDGGSTDACGIASYDLDIDTFTCADVGDNPVVLTVTDVNGNVSTCTAIVTVEDNTSPDLVCMDITLELGADGTATIVPADVILTNDDACGILTTAVDIFEFDCSDIGTPVTVQVFSQDVNGNLSTCTAVVTVVDLLAPELTCPPDQTVDPGPGNLFYEVPDYFANGQATAIDNCTDPVVITTQDPAAGTLLSDGTYTITCTATDEYGNTATCTFELTVESILGIGDEVDISSIVLYPNPATDYVMISNPNSVALQNVAIYDINGRLIKTVNLIEMGIEKAIDISELASATYMFIIQGTNGKLVKQVIKE